MSNILTLTGVSKSYQGVPAVQDVDLRVDQGERLAVIGPNGAGKSTLFGLIAGEHRPTRGRIVFDDRIVTRLHSSARAARGMSRTFQVARLFNSMTVRENLFMSALAGRSQELRAWDAVVRRKRSWSLVDEAIEIAGLESFVHSSASALPQGAR
ncbi:MAG: ATP-binding cassette domain-containing protein, partial [Microbacterium sp.]